MRNPARIQAAIELLEAVEQSLAEGGAAADVIVKAYFRTRRYAGSKDRAAVQQLLYAVLRRRAEILWRINGNADSRLEMITYLALTGEDFELAFDGSAHAPAPLDGQEQVFVEALRTSLNEPLPEWAAVDCPQWLLPAFQSRFGAQLASEMDALRERAPLDIRVNPLKADLAGVMAELGGRDVAFKPCALAPLGLRFLNPVDLSKDPLYLAGAIEVQDAGAQAASSLCAAKPGETVIDLCAGAGGKTLALAAGMNNLGVIHAFDTVARRLGELEGRATRAGVDIIQATLLPEEGEGRQSLLEDLQAAADLVLLDVPCSGTGTWRRNPEVRWRLTAERLDQYRAIQQSLLAEGALLVKPGGRLVYITCSLLEAEDEAQISAFLSAHPDFRLRPYADIWRQEVGGTAPTSLSTLPESLCLSPARHGTDGFFVSLMQKI
jgi:16S rRNA (cytosine967-C5)-methyltransferase